MPVDLSLPFGPFLRLSLKEYRAVEMKGAAWTERLLDEQVERCHAAWLKARKPKRKAVETDEEWWARLVVDHPGVDVRGEYVLAGLWAKSNARKCTRKFFENWLLKELRRQQKYGAATAPDPKRAGLSVDQEPASEWKAVAQEMLGDVPLAEWIREGDKGWSDLPRALREKIVQRLAA